MIARDLLNAHRGNTLRLPEDPKAKQRRYLIESVVHSHAGYVRVYTTGSRGPFPLTLANDTPVEVTP